MTSLALTDWNNSRRGKITLLWNLHSQLSGPQSAAWHAEAALAMVLQRMATEFQGFARGLHDEATEVFVRHVAAGSTNLETILRERMTADRALNKGNAHDDAVKRDFSRLGLTFWPTMQAADKRANTWEKELRKIVEMRNGVAHDDTGKILRLNGDGYNLDVPTLQSWHKMLDELCVCMDDVVGTYLSALLGIQRPW
ncbi:hypothetical protein [Actinacidiphila guanduensis]|uniref:hypothetical protein n=1 Tax=Actinacidiphila guanduensis TaxID=310781 RepID=UPI00115F86FC|nr:hypothetical protein [Actinacidiphila guanduensis]